MPQAVHKLNKKANANLAKTRKAIEEATPKRAYVRKAKAVAAVKEYAHDHCAPGFNHFSNGVK